MGEGGKRQQLSIIFEHLRISPSIHFISVSTCGPRVSFSIHYVRLDTSCVVQVVLLAVELSVLVSPGPAEEAQADASLAAVETALKPESEQESRPRKRRTVEPVEPVELDSFVKHPKGSRKVRKGPKLSRVFFVFTAKLLCVLLT